MLESINGCELQKCCLYQYVYHTAFTINEMYLNKTSEMSVHSLAQANIIGIFIIHLLVSCFKFGHCVLLQMTDSVFTNADVFSFLSL